MTSSSIPELNDSADLTPLAWVQEEVRRTLEGVHKVLRRTVREFDLRSATGQHDPEQFTLTLTPVANHLHQVAGVLRMVGQPEAAHLARANEGLVRRILAEQRIGADEAEALERADFALLTYITRLLAGNPVSPLGLFPTYRRVQELAQADRIHPADFWANNFSWQTLPPPRLSSSPPPLEALRSAFETALLRQMRQATTAHAAQLAELCVGLAVAFGDEPQASFWQLAAAHFEAQALGQIDADAFVKRLGSRLLAQLRNHVQGHAAPADRLVQDLLFYCAQSGDPPEGRAPHLQAVRVAYGLDGVLTGDYADETLGRIDPSLITQALKRVHAAKETWGAAAEGEMARAAGMDDAFSALGESLQTLFPQSEVLAQTLQRAAVLTLRAGQRPPAALAMEMATALLYLEAALEDATFDAPEQVERVQRVAQRVQAAASGQADETLEPWMEELFRRVADRQTLGSVVQELRHSLTEVERQVDEYFRQPSERAPLIPVPSLLQTMRGVFSVLGLDQAALTALRMRDEVDRLSNTEVDPTLEGPRAVFDRLANNLGQLGFLIDMLAVQAPLAKSMFRFDEASGELKALMERERLVAAPAVPAVVQETRAALATDDPEAQRAELARLALQAEADDRPALATAADAAARHLESALPALPSLDLASLDLPSLELETPAPAEAPAATAELQALVAEPPPVSVDAAPAALPASDEELDEEMLDIFLEEAEEVLETARAALATLKDDPRNRGELTTVRRSFHTLKGSSRMVGLQSYGEGAWACEQLYNDWLADEKPATDALLRFSFDAVEELAAWRQAIADHAAGAYTPVALQQKADALRLGRAQPASVVDFDHTQPPAEIEVHPDFEHTQPALEAEDMPVDGETAPSIESLGLVLDLDLPAEMPAQVAPAAAETPESVATTEPGVDDGVPAPDALEMEVPDAAVEPELVAEEALSEGFDLDLSVPEPAEPVAAQALPDFELQLDLGEPALEAVAAPTSIAETAEAELDFALDFGDLGGAPAVEAPADLSVDVQGGTVERDATPEDGAEAVVVDTADGEPSAAVDALSVAAVSDAGETLDAEALVPEAVAGESVSVDSTLPMDPSGETLEPAEPVTEAEVAAATNDDETRQIGSLRVPQALFSIFIGEADQRSTRLMLELQDWAAHADEAPPSSTEVYAHALAGSAATVGFDALSSLARALEHALGRAQRTRCFSAEETGLFTRAADEIAHLLHQFAAGFLKEPGEGLVEALQAYQPQMPVALDSAPGELLEEAQSAAPRLATIEFSDEELAGIDSELWDIFDEEAADLLPQLHARLRDWMGHAQDGSRGDACMRVLHTFKGGARLAGAMLLGDLAHQLESDIEAQMARGDRVAADLLPLQDRGDELEAAFEGMRQALVRKAQRPAVPVAEVRAAPEAEAVDLVLGEADSSEESVDLLLPEDVPATEAAAEEIPEVPEARVRELVPLPEPEPEVVVAPDAVDWSRFAGVGAFEISSADAAPLVSGQSLVRVRSALLDRMAAQAGEVSIRRARMENELQQMKTALLELDDNLERLRTQLRELEVQAEAQITSRQEQAAAAGDDFDPLEFDRYTRFQELTRMLAESVNDVATVQRSLQRNVTQGEDELAAQSRLTRELQDDLLRSRMVEFDSLTERLHRVVRQAAREGGKQVQLEVQGGGIELDRGVLERLIGAFEHLLRNSVAHGIETPAEREAAGKSPMGSIRIKLSQEGNQVLIAFSDDGAGLNLARIRDKALKQGLVQDGQTVSDHDLMQLIYAPGFSTASQVTELAGRGVGMDVVRAEVNTLGGYVMTRSQAGKGAEFDLRVPLTTALTHVVLLRCGEVQVAVPASLVETVLRVPNAQLSQAYASGRLQMGAWDVPVYWMGGLLAHNDHPQLHGKHAAVLVMRSGPDRVAIHVDEVVGNQEVVVKNLGPQLMHVPGLAGISLLPNGGVALIYNPVALAERYGAAANARAHEGGAEVIAPVEAAEVLAPLIMVVDDSLTVRRVTSRFLEREGFRVQLAKDGLDAMEQLARDELPHLILSDIEMPRMDGFDLVRNVRADERLRALPVIMITSRIAAKHREYADALGVQGYLGKPYDEQALKELILKHTKAAAAALT
ncbi:Hpt domain-containing protein [Inhella gelatinilytica]|uniref:Chemotaxis protein CheA n=1 Tax=Inhella gelatinilytica TaxID=2795030 RepID=A0A931NEG4_9BURK|nr:Hpt domain-containing protein [Inhella gelatinilytica]MBH9553205.1 Hpt domain-containing protein [Inhella gelatinilytica]